MPGNLYFMIVGLRLSPGSAPPGYQASHDVPVLRESIARRINPGSDVDTIRIYRLLSGPAHLALLATSWEPEQLLSLREHLVVAASSETRARYEEAFTWLSVYWPSPYAGSPTAVEVAERLRGKGLPWLVAYPMKKSPEWYLLPLEERRRIMAEHIAIARRAEQEVQGRIHSYTTYAFGLADHEFLVIYEVEDLAGWARVVEKLREARARKWIVREEPVIVGLLEGDHG